MIEPDLEALSLRELIHIPLNANYSQHTIHQPADNQVDETTFNFGILAPISEFPLYSAEIIAAADSAAKYINKNGGIDNRRLVILRADDKENTPVSAQLAQQLIENYKVKAIIGPATSSSVASILEQVSIKSRTPLISQAASSMALTDISKGELFWRMVANNRQQIDLILNFLHHRQRHSKIFIFTGRDMYGQEIADGLIDYYRSLKDGYIDRMSLSHMVYLADMNLKEEIEAIQKAGVTAIVITLVNSQVRDLLKKIRQHWKGPFPTILVGDTVTPKYLDNANLGKIKSCIFSYVGTVNDLDSSLREEITQAIDAYPTGFDGAYVYDATIILAMGFELSEEFGLPIDKAIKSITGNGFPVKNTDYAQIRELYKKHKQLQYSGLSGRVLFNEKGDNLTAFSRIYSVGHLSDKTKKNCLLTGENK